MKAESYLRKCRSRTQQRLVHGQGWGSSYVAETTASDALWIQGEVHDMTVLDPAELLERFEEYEDEFGEEWGYCNESIVTLPRSRRRHASTAPSAHLRTTVAAPTGTAPQHGGRGHGLCLRSPAHAHCWSASTVSSGPPQLRVVAKRITDDALRAGRTRTIDGFMDFEAQMYDQASEERSDKALDAIEALQQHGTPDRTCTSTTSAVTTSAGQAWGHVRKEYASR